MASAWLLGRPRSAVLPVVLLSCIMVVPQAEKAQIEDGGWQEASVMRVVRSASGNWDLS